MTEEKDNILGCYSQVGFNPNLEEQDFMKLANSFSPYIWGEKGISSTLKKLKHKNYGNDLKLVLFQFYIKPSPVEQQRLKSIESYRKKEKSIGIPVIITEENFFSKTEEERYRFLEASILQKLDLLAEVVKKKKLDTSISLLKSDLQKLFISHASCSTG
jgi:hypothetical protein